MELAEASVFYLQREQRKTRQDEAGMKALIISLAAVVVPIFLNELRKQILLWQAQSRVKRSKRLRELEHIDEDDQP